VLSQQSICCKVSDHARQGSSSPVGGTPNVCLPYFFEALSHMLLQQAPYNKVLRLLPSGSVQIADGRALP